jgi:hypothetical protein
MTMSISSMIASVLMMLILEVEMAVQTAARSYLQIWNVVERMH